MACPTTQFAHSREHEHQARRRLRPQPFPCLGSGHLGRPQNPTSRQEGIGREWDEIGPRRPRKVQAWSTRPVRARKAPGATGFGHPKWFNGGENVASPWKDLPFHGGIAAVSIASWTDFQKFADRSEAQDYVYRGQKSVGWKLLPKIYRGRTPSPEAIEAHLNGFRQAQRGRRAPWATDRLPDPELWALGQHFGLATPLLDWTESPYIAAFFAITDPNPTAGRHNKRRAVWALARDYTRPVQDAPWAVSAEAAIPVLRSDTQENQRLLGQLGLFTYHTDPTPLEDAVRREYQKSHVLIRFSLDTSIVGAAASALRSMNVTYMSLFPDLEGAARHCNARLE